MGDTEPETPSLTFEAISAERRMLWMGAVALFGFQLLTVFTPAFGEGLDQTEQRVHFLATALVALAIGVLLGPAKYLRPTHPSLGALEFARASLRSLRSGMALLGVATVLDFFLVACVILRGQIAIVLGVVLLIVFGVIWYVLPHNR